MMIFKTMCDNPSKFANEDDEENIVDKDYENVYQIFKDNYSELFSSEFAEERIFLYQFIYLINHAIKCNDEEWIKKEVEKLDRFVEKII